MLTEVGRGALRDVLELEVLMVLRGEIYALASLLGAIIVIAAHRGRLPVLPLDIVAAVATFAFSYGESLARLGSSRHPLTGASGSDAIFLAPDTVRQYLRATGCRRKLSIGRVGAHAKAISRTL
jgi:hypothetical protein